MTNSNNTPNTNLFTKRLIELTALEAAQVSVYKLTVLNSALTSVDIDNLTDSNKGLCYQVFNEVEKLISKDGISGVYYRRLLNKIVHLLDSISETYEYFSGSHMFPISSPIEGQSALNAYLTIEDRYTGEYGRRRLLLLDHWRKEVSRMLVEAKDALDLVINEEQ